MLDKAACLCSIEVYEQGQERTLGCFARGQNHPLSPILTNFKYIFSLLESGQRSDAVAHELV